mmetsp:Transcript_103627/g.269934  ORF Transcript_103627/g.269934 Transcript_103627/m.269934 type:complete len:228 (-) Transcript_103627:12-695(-)
MLGYDLHIALEYVQCALRDAAYQGDGEALLHAHRADLSGDRLGRPDGLLGLEQALGADVPGPDLDGELRRGDAALRARGRLGPHLAGHDSVHHGRICQLSLHPVVLPRAVLGSPGCLALAHVRRRYTSYMGLAGVHGRVHNLVRCLGLDGAIDGALRVVGRGLRLLERVVEGEPLQLRHGGQIHRRACHGLWHNESEPLTGQARSSHAHACTRVCERGCKTTQHTSR